MAYPAAVSFWARISRSPGWDRLTLEGELDLASSPILKAVLDRLERGPASVIVVDLRRVSFLDASGLHVLVAPEPDGGLTDMIEVEISSMNAERFQSVLAVIHQILARPGIRAAG